MANTIRPKNLSKWLLLFRANTWKKSLKSAFKTLGQAPATLIVAVAGLYSLEPILRALSKKYKIFVTYTIRRHDLHAERRFKYGIPHILDSQVLPLISEAQIIFEERFLAAANPFKNEIAIVIQGPVNHVAAFTFNTVERYLSLFLEAQVILSTWEDEDLSQFQLFQTNPNFHIVRTAKPEFSGMYNINLQILSSYAGVQKARGLACKYTVKTRTDQVFLNQQTLIYLWFLLKNYCDFGADSRIVALSKNTFLYRLYGISDMFLFGHTEDLEVFWSAPLDRRTNISIEGRTGNNSNVEPTLKSYSISELCEVYLVANYIRAKGIEPDFSFKHSLEVYRDLFVIADSRSIDLIWDKYTRNEDRWHKDSKPNPFYEVTFLDWLQMQDDLNPFLAFTSILDLPIKSFHLR